MNKNAVKTDILNVYVGASVYMDQDTLQYCIASISLIHLDPW